MNANTLIALAFNAYAWKCAASDFTNHSRFSLHHELHELEPPHLGDADHPLHRALPRRPRRLDDRCGPALDRRRARPDHVLPAVAGQRLRPRVRRPAAARRPHRRPLRPPKGLPDRAGRLRHRLARRRTGQQRTAADRHPLHQGPGGGVHRTHRTLDHHDELRRGPGAQPGPVDLHRVRRGWLLVRPALRWPDDRRRLALDVPAAGADRTGCAGRRLRAAAQGQARRGGRPRPCGRGTLHRRDAAARLHGRHRAGRGLDLGPDRRLVRPGGRAGRGIRLRGEPGQAPADPAGHPAQAFAGAGQPGHRRGGRLLLQLAVHRDPVPPGHAGLVAAEAGARAAAGGPDGRRVVGVLRQAGQPVRHHPDHRGHDGRDGGGLPAVPPPRHLTVVPHDAAAGVAADRRRLDRVPGDQHPGDGRRRRRRAGSGGRRSADLDAGRRRSRAGRHHCRDHVGHRGRHHADGGARRLPARAHLRGGGVDRRRPRGGARADLAPSR